MKKWGLFSFWRSAPNDSLNGVAGPPYLERYTRPVKYPKELNSFEWRRQLVMPGGGEWFEVMYYGKRHDQYPELIVGAHELPPKLIAIPAEGGTDILLFDGCSMVYNAMVCENYREEQLIEHRADNRYISKDGAFRFKIELTAYYQFDYEQEFEMEDSVPDGLITLDNGRQATLPELQTLGYDYFAVRLTSEGGVNIEVLSEGLA